MNTPTETAPNFIHETIERDRARGAVRKVVTRFPPEPNGYLHIGHAKAIVLNFEIAERYNGVCNLRFDDTNPVHENQNYTRAIQEDVRWLGYDYGERCYYTSDYFETLYEYAQKLIMQGDAYVDSLSAEEVRAQRGTPTEPGRESPYRQRSIVENARLFEEMRDGVHQEGSHLLRAKIDMRHPNLNMRDPVMYRILKRPHHRCGERWVIYPMYDFAHGQSDAIEGITHSLCTLEFENHRPLYDWFLKRLEIMHPPSQYEFARLNLNHTVLSKRRLQYLVDTKLVDGWDDPRLPTLRGMRRRGYPPEAVRLFCRQVGVTKVESVIDTATLEFFVRDVLNRCARRAMVVFDPLKVIIDNWSGEHEPLEAANNPEDPSAGRREVHFGRELYIERGDFATNPPPKYFRLAPGREVRLQHGYYITCTDWQSDAEGRVTEVHCKYDPQSRGGLTADQRKVRGTLHWVCCRDAAPVEVHRYERLFTEADVAAAERAGRRLEDIINTASKAVVRALAEPWVALSPPEQSCQFMRTGYFCYDPLSSQRAQTVVYNQTVALRDSWAKIQHKGAPLAR